MTSAQQRATNRAAPTHSRTSKSSQALQKPLALKQPTIRQHQAEQGIEQPHPPPVLDGVAAMRAAAEQACELMKVLANPDRLFILCQLAQAPSCVSELQTQLGIVQPTLSQQLTVLRRAGVVTTQRKGRHIYYSLAGTAVPAVMAVLYTEFCHKEAQ